MTHNDLLLRFVKSVKVEMFRQIFHSGNSVNISKANRSIDFFADSWFGKNNQLKWSIFPVGR